MNEEQKLTKKRNRWMMPVLALLLVVGAGLTVWQTGQADWLTSQISKQTATQATSLYQTSTVKKGSLSVSVSGTGTVVTATTIDLGFSATGNLAVLNVQVGDRVSQGQVLASLDGLDTLKLNVQEQQVAVQKAQKTLDDLAANQSTALAQALSDQAAAQKAYAEAQANLHQAGDARCSVSKTQDYYFQYLYAQQRVNEWEGYLNDPKTGYSHEYILQRLNPMRQERDQDYANYTYCQGYTAKEIQASQAADQLAKAKLDQANTAYETLKANSGMDLQAEALAQATLKNAQLQLEIAQKALSGTTITAPMDGIVTAVNGTVGSPAGTGAVISLADLSNPLVQVTIDETDLTNFAVGCSANVTFGALSGQTFPGVVMQVSPSLVTVQSVSMVEGMIELQKKEALSGKSLPLGLTAVAEVTCQQADNVLLAPVQAIYRQNGQAYVYVLDAQNQPEKRSVEVGIESVASAEIRSGLKAGEKVITSQVTTSQVTTSQVVTKTATPQANTTSK